MYVELHAHSYYSLLDGVPSPAELVQHAAKLNMPALAITDHNALYGAVELHVAAKAAGIKPIYGTEITLTNGGHLTLLAETDEGYKNLSRLITLARRDEEKGVAALPWQALTNHAKGLIALSGCKRGEIARALVETDLDKATKTADRYASIFGKQNFFLEFQRHHEYSDLRINSGLELIATRLGLSPIATGNVHYLTREQAAIQDVLTCIQHKVTLEKAGQVLRSNNEFFFRSPAEMMTLFVDMPKALEATREVAERCNAQLDTRPQKFPAISMPPDYTPEQYLARLCQNGLARKCNNSNAIAYQELLDNELAIIMGQELTGYFLVVWDIIRFARSKNIVCQGRGSAANSLVAYLLDITPIDPVEHRLEFGRFLSPERVTPPDIDIDFERVGREEVVQYIYNRYGHDHVAMACTINTFGAKSALRDVGKVFGFSKEMLKQIGEHIRDESPQVMAESHKLRAVFGNQMDNPRWKQMLTYAAAIDSFPRHLSVHVGGMIISEQPLADRVPIEKATKEAIWVTAFDKRGLEELNLVKVDILSLAILQAIADACVFIAMMTGKIPDLTKLRFIDQTIYEMISALETMGLATIGSEAQRALLIEGFNPRSFPDLTVEGALIRPGPVQGNMVHPYLNRRAGREPVTYLHPLLEDALGETLGIMLFQEQVIKVARDLAGFTPGEGELLRRAFGSKRVDEELMGFHKRFIEGALAKDVPKATAEKVFEQLRAFGSFSFAKSHAAAYAVISYWTAWLRRYHPAAFFAAIIRNQPLGFYSPNSIAAEAQRIGIEVLPIDLRYSPVRTTVEGKAIRVGLDYIRGLSKEQSDLLELERQRRPFNSVADLIKRTKLDRKHVEAIILSGAMNYLLANPIHQRRLLWDAYENYNLGNRPDVEIPLIYAPEELNFEPMTEEELLINNRVFGGITTKHLSILRRDAFTKAGAKSISQIWKMWNGQKVKLGGLAIIHQRPKTAHGTCFLTLEDPDGIMNVVVRPEVYAKCEEVMRRPFLIIDGVVIRRGTGKYVYIVAQNVTAV